MINFFRKIRKQLADDNKPLKYMRYAIGEIVLVVIGIIIAVQINTWANESKLNADNEVYLEKMITELELNKSRMEMLITGDNSDPIGLEEAVRNSDSLLKMTYRGFTIADTTFIFNTRLHAGGAYLNLHTSVYDELIKTGKLYTIGSDGIETAIKEYYRRCDREDLYNKRFTENSLNAQEVLGHSYYKMGLDHWADPKNLRQKTMIGLQIASLKPTKTFKLQ